MINKINEGNYFLFNERIFRSLAFKWMRHKKGWRKYEIKIILLSILTVISPFAAYVNLYNSSADKAISLLFGLFVFFAISGITVLLFNNGQKRYGAPFLFMDQLYLCSDEEGIRFYYHDMLDKRNSLSVIIQQISYAAIIRAEINQNLHMIILYGETECICHPNMYFMEKQTEMKVEGKLSFFECFSDEQLFLQVLQEQGIEIQYT